MRKKQNPWGHFLGGVAWTVLSLVVLNSFSSPYAFLAFGGVLVGVVHVGYSVVVWVRGEELRVENGSLETFRRGNRYTSISLAELNEGQWFFIQEPASDITGVKLMRSVGTTGLFLRSAVGGLVVRLDSFGRRGVLQEIGEWTAVVPWGVLSFSEPQPGSLLLFGECARLGVVGSRLRPVEAGSPCDLEVCQAERRMLVTLGETCARKVKKGHKTIAADGVVELASGDSLRIDGTKVVATLLG